MKRMEKKDHNQTSLAMHLSLTLQSNKQMQAKNKHMEKELDSTKKRLQIMEEKLMQVTNQNLVTSGTKSKWIGGPTKYGTAGKCYESERLRSQLFPSTEWDNWKLEIRLVTIPDKNDHAVLLFPFPLISMLTIDQNNCRVTYTIPKWGGGVFQHMSGKFFEFWYMCITIFENILISNGMEKEIRPINFASRKKHFREGA